MVALTDLNYPHFSKFFMKHHLAKKDFCVLFKIMELLSQCFSLFFHIKLN